jgi:primase-polymerase (primpol)-like protein
MVTRYESDGIGLVVTKQGDLVGYDDYETLEADYLEELAKRDSLTRERDEAFDR